MKDRMERAGMRWTCGRSAGHAGPANHPHQWPVEGFSEVPYQTRTTTTLPSTQVAKTSNLASGRIERTMGYTLVNWDAIWSVAAALERFTRSRCLLPTAARADRHKWFPSPPTSTTICGAERHRSDRLRPIVAIRREPIGFTTIRSAIWAAGAPIRWTSWFGAAMPTSPVR